MLAMATAIRTTAADESTLIEIITTETSREAKANACRELALVGTRNAIAPLATLLADEEMNHMARYALEAIPDPAVDEVLRANLVTLKGRPLIGVIGSLGVRGDTRAVAPLGMLLQDSNPEVVMAAARSLGDIGGTKAAELLVEAVKVNGGQLQLASCDGLLRCASALGAEGNLDQSLELYAMLRGMKGLPYQVTEAAIRGPLLSGGPQSIRLLRELLSTYSRDRDYRLFAAVVMATQAMAGVPVTRFLENSLDQPDPDWQILVLQALGRRGDFQALPALYAEAEAGDVRVQVAAIKAIGEIGVPMGAARLLELAVDEDAAVAAAAKETFGSLPGTAADTAVLELLNEENEAIQAVAVELIGRRRIADGLPLLFTLIGDEETDAALRENAWKQVGDLATANDIVALVDLIMDDEQPTAGAERALSAVCSRSPEPAACAPVLVEAVSEANPAQAEILIRLLGVTGGGDALETVREAAQNTDGSNRTVAVRTLAGWKTPDVIPCLVEQFLVNKNGTARTLALRAYLRWAANSDLAETERWAMCEQGATAVKQDQEKRLLLAALGKLNRAEALLLIQPYLSRDATREEAAAAVIRLAEVLLKGDQANESAADLIKPLEVAVKSTGNDELNRRAKSLLRQAQQTAGL